MASKTNKCKFKSNTKIGDKHWEWCSLYNAETSKLDCDNCEFRELNKKPLRIRREIIS